jgi:hypothetical protein
MVADPDHSTGLSVRGGFPVLVEEVEAVAERNF